LSIQVVGEVLNFYNVLTVVHIVGHLVEVESLKGVFHHGRVLHDLDCFLHEQLQGDIALFELLQKEVFHFDLSEDVLLETLLFLAVFEHLLFPLLRLQPLLLLQAVNLHVEDFLLFLELHFNLLVLVFHIIDVFEQLSRGLECVRDHLLHQCNLPVVLGAVQLVLIRDVCVMGNLFRGVQIGKVVLLYCVAGSL